MRRILVSFALAVLLVAPAAAGSTVAPLPSQEIPGAGPATGFGASVAVSGGTLLVGSQSGGARFYEKVAAGWQLATVVHAAASTPATVAIDGEWAAVGHRSDRLHYSCTSPGDGRPVICLVLCDGGSTVDLYRRNATGSWVFAQQLGPVDHDSGFGSALAMSDGVLAVGNPTRHASGACENLDEPYRGAVHVFELDQAAVWRERAMFTGAHMHDRMGDSVAVGGDVVAAGAPLADGIRRDVGSVVIARRAAPGSWTEEARVALSETAEFGRALAIDGPRLVVGAPRSTARVGLLSMAAGGVVATFEQQAGGWQPTSTIRATHGGGVRDGFGEALATSSGVLVVGAAERTSVSACACGGGDVFVWTAGSWAPAGIFAADDGDARAVGEAVAVDGTTLWVGAPESADGTGRLYGYELQNVIPAGGVLRADGR